MTLYIIGLGLHDEKDISVRGLELVKHADVVFLEAYTSILQVDAQRLSSFYGKDVKLADRATVEQHAEEKIIAPAINGDVVLLVAGDPLGATTHTDIISRCKQHGVRVELIHNASILTAVAQTGLQLYKFGKTASIPYAHGSYAPDSFLDIVAQNQSIGAHTLLLLDLDPLGKKFMTVNEALVRMVGAAVKRNSKIISEKTFVVGCARLGTPGAHIACGPIEKLVGHNFGGAPHCVIIPAQLHFSEEEVLKQFRV